MLNFQEQDMIEFDAASEDPYGLAQEQAPTTNEEFQQRSIKRWRWLADSVITGGNELTDVKGQITNQQLLVIKM